MNDDPVQGIIESPAMAHLRAERDAANDALRAARAALGDDDQPFLDDAIRKIKAEREVAVARACAERDAAVALLDKAKALAHATGLFQGGYEPDLRSSLVDIVASYKARAERAEADADRLAAALRYGETVDFEDNEAHGAWWRDLWRALAAHDKAVAQREVGQ